MKKSILIYLFALLPLVSTFAQYSSTNSSCGASCFWTWCTITCYDPNGDLIGAQCYCSWGFAHCKCLRSKNHHTAYNNYSLEQTEAQRADLLAFKQELDDNGYGDLAVLVQGIQNGIDRGEDVIPLIDDFVERVDALPASDQAFFKERIGTDGVDTAPPLNAEPNQRRRN